jgi:hypothetical protein
MRVWLAFVVAVSCAGEDAQLTARFAPEMKQTPRATIAVLGVLKRGRMSADAWTDLSPAISSAFGSSVCAAAFDSNLDGRLASAVDKHARDNGVTDALFGAFAGATTADLILLVETSGQLPAASPRDGGASDPARGGPMRGGSRQMGGGMGAIGTGGALHPMGPPSEDDGTRDALEMSASIYSIRLGRSVGSIGMRYTGKSADDAVRRFAQKLGESLEGTRCAGWKSDAWPDADAVRTLHVE